MTARALPLRDWQVQALARGELSEIRRPADPQPDPWRDGWAYESRHPAEKGTWVWPSEETGLCQRIRSPFGGVGARLYVQETFAVESNYGVEGDDRYPPPFSDGRPVLWQEDEDMGRYWMQPHYRATDPEPEICCESERCRTCGGDGPGYGPHWQPATRMRRWASRWLLEVTAERVERVQEATADGARASGVAAIGESFPLRVEPMSLYGHALAHLWDEQYSHRPGLAWEANPYVFVATVRRVEP